MKSPVKAKLFKQQLNDDKRIFQQLKNSHKIWIY